MALPLAEVAGQEGWIVICTVHSFVCERFICFQDRSTYFPAAEWADRSREYIYRSQTHQCGNSDCGRTIPFLGICVSNFRYSFFAVWRLWTGKQEDEFTSNIGFVVNKLTSVIFLGFSYFFIPVWSDFKHLSPLTLPCARGCWDWTQDCCNIYSYIQAV